ISIDDNEQKNLNNICDEIFGEKNRVAIFPWRKRTAKSDVPFGVSQDYEWIICYSKGSLFSGKIKGKGRNYYETPDFPGRPWRIHDMTKQTTASERPNSFFTMINPKNGDEFPCDPNRTWRITKDTFKKYYDENEIVFPGDYKFLKITKPQARYFKDKDQEKDGDSFGKVALSTKLPEDIGMSQNGTKDIKNIFGAIPFSFPKPVSLIKYILAASTFNNSIVLDFFSGSSTTAHAVMKLNSEDGGNRKFIMVQLPETCDEKSEAYKAGYKTICDIGKERIRRAGDKIVSEMKSTEGDLFTESKPELDIGFKVFQLDSTNIKPWDSEIQIDEDELTNFSDVFKEDRTKEDILYEIMLKYGVFDEPVTEEVVNGKTMYRVGKRHMLVCLEDDITTLDVKAIGELKPKVVIFKDSGFRNDNDKINAVYNLKNAGIEDVKSI
ncbi:MAG: site-specific DNA-methyltransferase, partial [Spirochaetales bacterium]|nr:site-specific DNA-methyltransferase [Spirochaetales bacterium]